MLLPSASAQALAVAAVSARDGGAAQWQGERVKVGVHDAVVGSTVALLAGDQPGVGEPFEVVRHGRLRQAGRVSQFAHARFAVTVGRDQRQEPHTGWVPERLEGLS